MHASFTLGKPISASYPKCIHRLPLEDKKIDSKVGFPMSTGTVQINIKEATFKQYYD